MRRADQFVLIGSAVPLAWLAMMAVHEAGHVLGAILTGGTVKVIVLHPLKISCTVLSHNPHPLLVTWAGPVIGVLIPLAAFGVAAAIRMPGAYLLRFFAGFCMIVNGIYIGVGSIERIYDADDLLRHGSQTWHLWLFGAVTIPLALLLWHRLGPYFGLGKARGQVSRGAAIACLVLLVLVAGLEFVLGPYFGLGKARGQVSRGAAAAYPVDRDSDRPNPRNGDCSARIRERVLLVPMAERWQRGEKAALCCGT